MTTDTYVKTRFCTSCQCHREEATGEMRISPKSRRWICRLCLEHKSPSIYRNMSGRPANVTRIMARLTKNA